MSLAEKIEDLRDGYIADDNYFDDIVIDCYAQIRAIYHATSLDDKLAAVDALKIAIMKSADEFPDLQSDAQEFLNQPRELGDIEAYKSRRAA